MKRLPNSKRPKSGYYLSGGKEPRIPLTPTRRQYTALVGALGESPMKEALVAAGLGHVKFGDLCRHMLKLGKNLPPPAVDATVTLRGLASKALT